MSLKNEKHEQLLNDKHPIDGKRWFHFMLVMMFFIQLILPIGIHAQGETGDGENSEPVATEVQAPEEESVTNIESPMSLNSQSEDAEEDGNHSQESEESPAEETSEDPPEEIAEDPVEKPKEKIEEQPPAQEPAEELKEEVKEEEIVREKIKVDEAKSIMMLDNFLGTQHPANPTPIIRYAPGSLARNANELQGTRMKQKSSGLAPGEVRTSKTAEPVDGMVNTWDIIVRVEGRDDEKVETTDVVLVIDRSGSMADNSRMTNAKSAARNFIDTMILADPNLEIAIVSFSSDYVEWPQSSELITVNHQFSDNQTTLKSAINSLNAFGGTHTQAGIIQGQTLLDGSGADNKYMVLLSDGEPTFSYRPNNWTTVSESKRGAYSSGNSLYATSPAFLNYSNQYGVYDGNFNSGIVVGSGNRVTSSAQTYANRWWPYISDSNLEYYPATSGWGGDNPVNLQYIDNGSAAIKAGQDVRSGLGNSGVLFTIAVQAGAEGTPILEQIATPGLAYSTQNPGDLQDIYDQIGTQIATQYALRFPTMTDEIGDGFTLIESTLNTTEGTTSVDAATGSNNQTINWDISPTVTNLVPGTTDVRYAEMTYRVEINDDILDIPGAKTNDSQLFETNRETTLNYLDSDDNNQTRQIESPEVDPVLLKVKKILLDGYGEPITNDGRRFDVNINKNNPNGFDHDESLVPGADYVWLTTLRHEGAYNVEEIGITGDGETNLNQFIITYNIDGATQISFEVNHEDEGIPRGDVVIDVTNQELSKIDITGTKEWLGGPTDKPDIQLQLVRNGADYGEPITLTAGETSYTWTGLDGIDAQGNDYVYTVEEVNAPDNYDSEADGTTVTNTYDIPISGTATATKIWEGGLVEDYFEVDLTLWRTIDGENFDMVDANPIITPNTEDTEYSYIWTNLEETDFEGNEYTFYFTEDEVPDGFERIYSDPTIVGDVAYQESGGTVTNRQMLIDFSFIKVDEVGNPLEGATFTLEKHVDGGPNEEMTNTGMDPEFLYEGLTVGWYTLTEVEAPEDYILPTENTWTFEVFWNEETNALDIRFEEDDALELEDEQYEVANYPKGRLPETGGPGITQSIIIGLFSLTMLGTVYVWQLKRDEVFPND